jgi:uncharacterized protein (DUF697 family)
MTEINDPQIEEPESEEADLKVTEADRSDAEIEKLIKWHMYCSFSIGLIPIPVVDMAALSIVQLNLIRKLAEIYNVPFFKEKVKNLITPLITATMPSAVGPAISSSIKCIPIIGQGIGVLTMPMIASAITFATGKVFVRHFNSGGTFLTFDANKAKEYYAEMYEQGKESAAQLKKEKTEAKADA